MKRSIFSLAVAIAAVSSSAFSQTPIKVGVSLALTGPAASVGVPEKNSILLAPKTIGTHPLQFIILDDSTDPTSARKNVEKLMSEDHVDLILGGANNTSAFAIADVAATASTPYVALSPPGKVRDWVFQVPYSEAQYSKVFAAHMKTLGIKTFAYIGFNDPYGESWAVEMQKATEVYGIKMVASERFERTATSVIAQALKIMSANPDAVMIGASAGPGVLPQSTLVGRGFKGKIYQGPAVINSEFLRLGGKDVEGTLLVSGPLAVLDLLPANHPNREDGMKLKTIYEAAYGTGKLNNFSAYAWDGIQIVTVAAQTALAKGTKPGTPEFRKALRDALEQIRDVKGVLGTISFSPSKRIAYDGSSLAMITIRGNRFVPLE